MSQILRQLLQMVKNIRWIIVIWMLLSLLDIAEVRALAHEPMYMKDWMETIDDYLKMTRRDILTTKSLI